MSKSNIFRGRILLSDEYGNIFCFVYLFSLDAKKVILI